jgi:GTP cyclohydrolase II
LTTVRLAPAATLRTRFGPFALHRFAARGSEPVLALVRGELGGAAPLLARVHSSCMTSEFLGGLDCDCAEQLAHALATIAAEGRGLLVYLMQEGRGAGLVAKGRDRMMVQAHGERITTFDAFERMGLPRDRRSYEAVVEVLPRLGVEAPLRLLTHNPEKRARLAALGVAIAESVPLPPAHSPWNAHYLAAKARHGHALVPGDAEGARLPERVAWFEPHALPALPRFVRAASWLLPVPEGWLRATVYEDLIARRPRLVLEPLAPGAGAGAPLRLLQAQSLLDRLPLAPAGPTRRAWRAAAAALVERGRGRALVLEPDEPEAPDAETLALLALDAAA